MARFLARAAQCTSNTQGSASRPRCLLRACVPAAACLLLLRRRRRRRSCAAAPVLQSPLRLACLAACLLPQGLRNTVCQVETNVKALPLRHTTRSLCAQPATLCPTCRASPTPSIKTASPTVGPKGGGAWGMGGGGHVHASNAIQAWPSALQQQHGSSSTGAGNDAALHPPAMRPAALPCQERASRRSRAAAPGPGQHMWRLLRPLSTLRPSGSPPWPLQWCCARARSIATWWSTSSSRAEQRSSAAAAAASAARSQQHSSPTLGARCAEEAKPWPAASAPSLQGRRAERCTAAAFPRRCYARRTCGPFFTSWSWPVHVYSYCCCCFD